MKEFIDIIKSDKKSKMLFIITIGVLFICTISYSLSIFSNNKQGKAANIKVNGLSFNMTTNSGEEDDRILKLKANTLESFNVTLTNLNTIDVKYEIIYEVCTDNSCTSTLDKLPDDVVFGVSSDVTDKVSDIIEVGSNNSKTIILLSNNNTNTDYYIKLNLNAGYSWNELALINQIDTYHKNVDFIAYVDGVEQSNFPNSCDYTYTYKTYKNGVETTDSTVTLTCTNNTWNINVTNVPNKVKVYFKPYLIEYISLLGKQEESKKANGLEEDTTVDKNLRYVGSNPNNYVSFNNELWRIIGVFDTYDASESGATLSTHSKKVKLIRAEPIGDYAFDVSENGECNNRGCGGYNVSNLMQELNGDYLNNSLTSNPMWYGGVFLSYSNTSQKEFDRTKVIKTSYQDMIANVVWNTGGILDSDAGQDTFTAPTINVYNAERSNSLYKEDDIIRTSTWNGKIGLMYWSDYGYSSKDEDCRSNLFAGINMNGSTEEELYANMKCKNENWLNIVPDGYSATTYENLYGWWTLSSYVEYGNRQFSVFSVGGGYDIESDNALGVLPTLYLKSEISIVSGNGTSEEPYILSLNN